MFDLESVEIYAEKLVRMNISEDYNFCDTYISNCCATSDISCDACPLSIPTPDHLKGKILTKEEITEEIQIIQLLG